MGYTRVFLVRKLRLNRVLPLLVELRWIVIARIVAVLFACFLLLVYTYVITLFLARSKVGGSSTSITITITITILSP